MLPVSGAEQLNTSLAMPTRPISSAHSAYSRLVRPGPSNSKLSSTMRPARLRRHEQVPDALRLGAGLLLLDHREHLPAIALGLLPVVIGHPRADVRLDEIAHAIAPVALTVGEIEVHAASFPSSGWVILWQTQRSAPTLQLSERLRGGHHGCAPVASGSTRAAASSAATRAAWSSRLIGKRRNTASPMIPSTAMVAM